MRRGRPRAESGVAIVVNRTAIGLDAHTVRHVVRHVLLAERTEASVSVTFLSRRRMRALNRQFLHHDHVTDVLAFALRAPDGGLGGEVYLCRWQAAVNARVHGVRVRDELLRLVVHGTLHLLGWDHPDGASRSRSKMWRRQEALLKAMP